MTLLNEFLGAVLQLFVFIQIPLWVYFFQNKNIRGFWNSLGLKPSNWKANTYAILGSLLISAPLISLGLFNEDFRQILLNPSSVTGKIKSLGFSTHTVLIILVVSVFKTSFTEELFFRGFVAKKLIKLLGFVKGNLLQALLFGVMHTILFLMASDNLFFLLVIGLIPALGAYISGYLNEKIANGSIVPGWISHGLANVLAYTIIPFV